MVDHHHTAGRQFDFTRIRGLDLVLDLEPAEQRRVVAVALDACRVLGHHMRHELLGLLKDVVGVDQDVTDILIEVIADRANDQRRLLIDQEGALATLGRAVDRVP